MNKVVVLHCIELIVWINNNFHNNFMEIIQIFENGDKYEKKIVS